MSDHRALIKIEMEFHGVKDKCEMYINYYPHDCCGMDERVIEFFKRIYEQGMEKYQEAVEDYEEKRWKKEIESAERSELERLKAKYDQK